MSNKITILDVKKLTGILQRTEGLPFDGALAKSQTESQIADGAKALHSELELHILPDALSKRTVLGIDILGYSQYDTFTQSLIPIVFHSIYDLSIDLALKSQHFLFQKENKLKLQGRFIDTGDGGFQILYCPLHGIAFIIAFSMMLRAYNSGEAYPHLRTIVKQLSVRFVLTYGDLYEINFGHRSNYYGSAIIKNARIMSQDKLDRFLIDNDVQEWFMNRTAGIESLEILDIADIAKLKDFSDYDQERVDIDDSIFAQGRGKSKITACDILKIGTIRSKEDSVAVYNLCMKVQGRYSIRNYSSRYVLSIGNYNTEGLVKK